MASKHPTGRSTKFSSNLAGSLPSVTRTIGMNAGRSFSLMYFMACDMARPFSVLLAPLPTQTHTENPSSSTNASLVSRRRRLTLLSFLYARARRENLMSPPLSLMRNSTLRNGSTASSSPPSSSPCTLYDRILMPSNRRSPGTASQNSATSVSPWPSSRVTALALPPRSDTMLFTRLFALSFSCAFDFSPFHWYSVSPRSSTNTSPELSESRRRFTWRRIKAPFTPLIWYSLGSTTSSSTWLNPVSTPPSRYVTPVFSNRFKNARDSCSITSRCWMARSLRKWSSSTVLYAAVPYSSCELDSPIQK
mmetsp:Transcript_11764/g.29937  ORF Transcript_11764/g.29937 Transcript_11764/m.29937 type:complete len:306 (-) Transcript_11764:370-1287(-)